MKKIKYFLISSVLLIVAFNACKKIEHQNEIPLVITGDTSNIQLTSAIVTGTVTPNDAAIQSSGHVWSSINQLPAYSANEGKTTTNGLLPQNKIISNLTNLSPGKIYYVRGFIISGIDTVYGNVIKFSTVNYQPPVLTTDIAGNITFTSANVGATVTSIGNTPITQHGHVWSNINQTPTIADSLTSLGSLPAPATYSSSLSNLSAGTIYYVRAYAVNNAGTTYGNVITLTTLSNFAPSVTTNIISNISINSATAAGSITNTGSTPVSQYGHVWSSANNLPTISDSKTQLGIANSPINFSGDLSGLQPNTTYYVRAYATNIAGTSYGAVISFTTAPVINNPPAVTTANISLVTVNSAVAAGNITDIGSTPVTQYGHVWSSTNNTPTTADSKSDLGNANAVTSYNTSLPGLQPNTTYYVRAYATNSAGTTYGAVISFTTAQVTNNPPAVTTGNISLVTINSATAAGNITDIGSTRVTHYGHVWSSANNTPTTADSKSDLGNANAVTSYNTSLTGLQPNTTFYVRAYATNNGGTTYGAVITFTTGAAPNNPASVTTDSIRQITGNSATAYGTITNIGNSSVTQYGHVWSSTNNLPTVNDSKTQLGSANAPTNFNSQLTGLSAGTTYYVRAYAINNGGTSYGAVVTFTTSSANNLPVVYIANVYNVFVNYATSDGTITDIGGSPITQYGHVWSSTNNLPTVNDNKTQLGATNFVPPISFTSYLSGLSANTTYYIRAYATNSSGTAYSSTVLTFTTYPAQRAPSVTTGGISSLTSNSVNVAGNVTDVGYPSVTQYGHGWVNTNTQASYISDFGRTNVPISYTSSLTGLDPGTLYYIYAYARNGIEARGAAVGFTTLVGFVTNTVNTITSNTAKASAGFRNDGRSQISQYGHVWSSTNNLPTIANNDNKTVNPPQFNSSLTGLTPNTTYYVRAYAINDGGTSYSNVTTFTTTAAFTPAAVTTGDPFVTRSFVNFPATITDTGNSPVTQHGHVWSTTNTTPTLSDNFNQLGTASSGSYNSTLGTNVIVSGTTYYVRAYVTNSAGTSYGAVKTFKY